MSTSLSVKGKQMKDRKNIKKKVPTKAVVKIFASESEDDDSFMSESWRFRYGCDY